MAAHTSPTTPSQPPLLLVAHGTESPVGVATVVGLVDALRRSHEVELAFLDVARPRLPDVVAGLAGPAVLVPLLLSTGYHVQQDIPGAVAGRSEIVVARHLGPHPLLVDAALDRLPPGVDAAGAGSVVLVATGSSRPEAALEVTEAAALVAHRIGRDVSTATMADDLHALFDGMAGPVVALTYLLSEGRFADSLRGAAGASRNDVVVGDPIGEHPALLELVQLRYRDAPDG